MENLDNRSEELAKLLGIKPIILTCKKGIDCDKPQEYCLICKNKTKRVREICPDFYKPNNFVKLMEMPDIFTKLKAQQIKWEY